MISLPHIPLIRTLPFLLFSLFSYSFLSAQCTNGNQPECACETAPVLCTVDELDGYTYSMSPFLHPQDGPSPICPGANQTQTNNPTWFAFTAWCTNLTLRVTTDNCHEVQNYIGFQLAVYEDCSFDNVVACNADVDDCSTDDKILAMSGLSIGAVYYFMVDGCLGSYCDVHIDVIGVCGQEEISPWTMPIDGNQDPCSGQTETYTVEHLDGSRIYHWFLDGVPISQTVINHIDLDWTIPGTYTLCIDASNDPCVPISDPPAPLCTTIVVHESEAGVLDVMPSLVCPMEPVQINSTGFTVSAENNQIILITNAAGWIVEIINASSGSFTSPVSGIYTVYAYNYLNSGSIPLIGSNINAIDCITTCCDLESQIITIQGIQAVVSNIECDNNGTGNDTTDDTFTFDVLVTGQITGTSWRSTDGTLEGTYGTPLSCGPYPVSAGFLTFDLHDYEIPTCWTSIDIFAPLPCSVCMQTIDAGSADTIDCKNTILTLTGSSSTMGTYLWTGPDQFSSTTLMTMVSDSGWYYLTGFFANQCSMEDSVYVAINHDRPLAIGGPDLMLDCTHSEVVIDGSSSSGNNLEFSWLDQPGQIISTQNICLVNTAGIYTLQLTNSITGCAATDTIEVILIPNDMGWLALTVNNESCEDENDGLIALSGIGGGSPPYTYSLSDTVSNTIGQFEELSPGIYNVQVTDADGCQLDTVLTIQPGVYLDLTLPEFLEVITQESGVIHPVINVPVTDLSSIQWTPADLLSCPTCLTTTITPTNSQTLQLTVIHLNGCIATAQLNVLVVAKTQIYIPNIFSPNGDGLNDYFNLYSNDRVSSILTLNIYDRWGEHIYQGSDLRVDGGWDGKFHGEELNEGVFVYSFEVLLADGNKEVFTGSVTLVK